VSEKKRKRGTNFIKHTEESKKLISNARKAWLKNNPDKHVWKRSDKFKSEPCEFLKSIFRDNNINFIEEYSPLEDKNYSIDISFPNLKIGIEVNGNQHYNSDGTLKEYYFNRKNEIESIGWKLYDIHYSNVYKNEFIISLIDYFHKNNLDGLDLSFFIKKKKIKKSRSEKYQEKIDPIILNIKQSNIDFNKNGWVKKVSEIIGVNENKGGWWIKKNMKEFYNEKCKKRKVIYKDEISYYKNPKFCLDCGDVIQFEKRDQKFCSRSCSSSFNNKRR
jgi:very-short-patch-repair endonuclease